MISRWFRKLLSLIKYLTILSLSLVLLFAFVPVPLTGVMIERHIQAWWNHNSSYQLRHNWVPFEQISGAMKQAVVAAEDQKFPDHFGFDTEAIEKALVYNSKGRKVRGASTISQQTAKNVFLWTGRSWFRKGLELVFTGLIELAWGKERILEVYLNSVEFGPGIFGVEAAAQKFFKRPASQLNRHQAALLAAVLPNPLRFKVQDPSPYVYKRQQWILKQMRQLAPVEQRLAAR
ncbi:monofunctional biosynthetic peptidoglycan transglycosylase [Rheinheimera mesophila]|uniref:Biosynthetic peptidoglycan transglycosylase n=1 Tax=Rheinheimera mesophila TaxID=1547515 RepID=A0A3P3QS82_9GAMM|nr:monofunctional biosynthetic peptidoglycan transglycosylase [Rheinheimera mesophila]KKL03289.1 peptidoglycan transglycosylase [Rheinheimera mesophila]RRJ23588.1 monofunctional biosynthetic peptidoglycan transglycosylase [Rheinheimera mesophila]